MDNFEKRLGKIEQNISNISDFIFALEKKSETYWAFLKNTIMSVKNEINNFITKEYIDKVISEDLNQLKMEVKRSDFFK